MKNIVGTLMGILLLAGFTLPATAFPKTLVILRHGDKNDDQDWNHNLNAAGLKRSLALPNVLLTRYGKPAALFAPQPQAPHGGNIRSIQLITPTAVQAEVNIDTRFSVGDEKALAQFLASDPGLEAQVVFVVWEHKAIPEIVEAMGIKNFPRHWKSNDFDSLWVIRRDRGTLDFSVEAEGLNP